MKAFHWTQEAVVYLEELHKQGHPFSRIAAMLGEKFGGYITRNSVIGKATRLHLDKRIQPKSKQTTVRISRKRGGAGRMKVVQIVKLGPPEPMPSIVPDSGPVPLLISLTDLRDGHCRWPIGEPRDPAFAFCGHSQVNGLPYCPHHQQLAWTAPQFRKATIGRANARF